MIFFSPDGAPALIVQAHDFAPAAAFQGDLEFADQVFGFVLDLKIAVAQDAKGAVALDGIARIKRAQMQKQHFFER